MLCTAPPIRRPAATRLLPLLLFCPRTRPLFAPLPCRRSD